MKYTFLLLPIYTFGFAAAAPVPNAEPIAAHAPDFNRRQLGNVVEGTTDTLLDIASDILDSAADVIGRGLPPRGAPGDEHGTIDSRSFVDFTGDIMGSALNNLDVLLSASAEANEQALTPRGAPGDEAASRIIARASDAPGDGSGTILARRYDSLHSAVNLAKERAYPTPVSTEVQGMLDTAKQQGTSELPRDLSGQPSASVQKRDAPQDGSKTSLPRQLPNDVRASCLGRDQDVDQILQTIGFCAAVKAGVQLHKDGATFGSCSDGSKLSSEDVARLCPPRYDNFFIAQYDESVNATLALLGF